MVSGRACGCGAEHPSGCLDRPHSSSLRLRAMRKKTKRVHIEDMLTVRLRRDNPTFNVSGLSAGRPAGAVIACGSTRTCQH